MNDRKDYVNILLIWEVHALALHPCEVPEREGM